MSSTIGNPEPLPQELLKDANADEFSPSNVLGGIGGELTKDLSSRTLTHSQSMIDLNFGRSELVTFIFIKWF